MMIPDLYQVDEHGKSFQSSMSLLGVDNDNTVLWYESIRSANPNRTGRTQRRVRQLSLTARHAVRYSNRNHSNLSTG